MYIKYPNLNRTLIFYGSIKDAAANDLIMIHDMTLNFFWQATDNSAKMQRNKYLKCFYACHVFYTDYILK